MGRTWLTRYCYVTIWINFSYATLFLPRFRALAAASQPWNSVSNPLSSVGWRPANCGGSEILRGTCLGSWLADCARKMDGLPGCAGPMPGSLWAAPVIGVLVLCWLPAFGKRSLVAPKPSHWLNEAFPVVPAKLRAKSQQYQLCTWVALKRIFCFATARQSI